MAVELQIRCVHLGPEIGEQVWVDDLEFELFAVPLETATQHHAPLLLELPSIELERESALTEFLELALEASRKAVDPRLHRGLPHGPVIRRLRRVVRSRGRRLRRTRLRRLWRLALGRRLRIPSR